MGSLYGPASWRETLGVCVRDGATLEAGQERHRLRLAPSPIFRAWLKEQDPAWMVLRQCSLVLLQTEPPDTFTVHPLVQAIVRLNLKQDDQVATSWGKSVAFLMASAPSDGISPEGWAGWESLAPHVRNIRDSAAQEVQENLVFAELLNRFAQVLQYIMGAYEEAEPLYRQSLEALQGVLGTEHPDTLTSLNSLAILLHSLGKYPEADLLYSQSLRGPLKVGVANGQPHPNLDTVMSNYSNFLIEWGMTSDEAKNRIMEILAPIKTQAIEEK